MPSFHPETIADTGWSELALRFVFGGAVTVATGLIADAYGPAVGGLFLAFPAILPASLTLLKQHHDRRDAVRAAEGSRLGAVGLCGFAIVTALLASTAGAVPTLAAAGATWAVVSVTLWWLVYHRRHRHARHAAPAR